MIAAAREAFDRLGDTVWVADPVILEDPSGCFRLRGLGTIARRQLTDSMNKALPDSRDRWVSGLVSPDVARLSGPPVWSLRLDAWPDSWTESDAEGVDEVVLPASADTGSVPFPVRLSLPLLIREGRRESDLRMRVGKGLRAGVRRWEISSLPASNFFARCHQETRVDFAELQMSGDWPLHVLNPERVAWYAEEGRIW